MTIRWASAWVVALLLALSTATQAEAPGLDWVYAIGGPEAVECRDIVVGADGSVYAVGAFAGEVDFDPGPGFHRETARASTFFDRAAFVTKSNVAGQLQWVRRLDTGRQPSVGEAIALDSEGNLLVVGCFGGTAIIEDGTQQVELTGDVPYSGRDMFVVKFRPDGSVVWASNMGGMMFKRAVGISLDSAGNSYVVGAFQEPVNNPPTPDPLGKTGTGTFLCKVDSSGAVLWVRSIAGEYGDTLPQVAATAAGDVYLARMFVDAVTVGEGHEAVVFHAEDDHDILITRQDTHGNLVWARRIGGAHRDSVYSMAVLDGGVVIAGSTSGERPYAADHALAETPFVGQAQFSRAFISKLDENGDLVWTETVTRAGSKGGGRVGRIQTNDAGVIFWTGSFSHPVAVYHDHDASAPSTGGENASHGFVGAMSREGRALWMEPILHGPDCWLGPIALSPQGEVQVAGSFGKDLAFLPEWGGAEFASLGRIALHRDYFVAKLRVPVIVEADPSDELMASLAEEQTPAAGDAQGAELVDSVADLATEDGVVAGDPIATPNADSSFPSAPPGTPVALPAGLAALAAAFIWLRIRRSARR